MNKLAAAVARFTAEIEARNESYNSEMRRLRSLGYEWARDEATYQQIQDLILFSCGGDCKNPPRKAIDEASSGLFAPHLGLKWFCEGAQGLLGEIRNQLPKEDL